MWPWGRELSGSTWGELFADWVSRDWACVSLSAWVIFELQKLMNPLVPVFCHQKKYKRWSTYNKEMFIFCHHSVKFQSEIIGPVAGLHIMKGVHKEQNCLPPGWKVWKKKNEDSVGSHNLLWGYSHWRPHSRLQEWNVPFFPTWLIETPGLGEGSLLSLEMMSRMWISHEWTRSWWWDLGLHHSSGTSVKGWPYKVHNTPKFKSHWPPMFISTSVYQSMTVVFPRKVGFGKTRYKASEECQLEHGLEGMSKIKAFWLEGTGHPGQMTEVLFIF